ncbi:hypothetical protein ANRL3_01918 [Anaerolineae bacterium]|nr:hypothetical protein ANRL3_01918 [Anaerolineae bacterium]
MLQSYAYRLYPNRSQFVALGNLLEIHRSLYNAALEERREAWRKHHISINYSMQARQLKAIREFDPEFAEMNYSACQQTLRRVNKAFQDFFRRIRLGRNSGYPRFKSQSRFNSVAFVFGDGATRNNGRLKIQGVGAIKVKWHRPIPGNTVIKQVVIHRKLDLWYATFQIDLPDETVQPHPGEPIGVDFGLTNLIALERRIDRSSAFFPSIKTTIARATTQSLSSKEILQGLAKSDETGH